MLKFSKNVDLTNSLLLLSFTSAGLTGNFASSILINNHNFESIGFFFSHYLCPYVGKNPGSGGLLFNGQAYFNQDQKILLLNFHAGVPHHFRNEFASELLTLFSGNSMRGIIIYGGIGKNFLNDEELRLKEVSVYYLTNDKSFSGQNFGVKNFETLVNLENKKKFLEEVQYLDRCGVAKHLIKFFSKKNVTFHYFFAFSSELFDPLAGLALYYKISNILGFTQDGGVSVPKAVDNLNDFLDTVEKQFKIESTWRLFLKE